MTKEELLQPRYLVNSLYPDSPFFEGQIIHKWTNGLSEESIIVGKSYTKEDYDKYPAIFEPLSWYKFRTIDEMPEYLIVTSKEINNISKYHGVVIKCGMDKFWLSNKFSITKSGFVSAYGNINLDCFNPATQEEYEINKNSK